MLVVVWGQINRVLESLFVALWNGVRLLLVSNGTCGSSLLYSVCIFWTKLGRELEMYRYSTW